MIKQYLFKRAKIAYGFLNTYIRRAGRNYDETEWWDASFYTEGVSDRQTLSKKKNVISAMYHYASLELQILKHLRNTNASINQANIVDIGSGSGHWLDFYQKLEPNKITGMDVSVSSFNHLKKKYFGASNVEIHHGKALDVIGNLTSKYNIVNAIGVMFHIVDDSEWQNTIVSVANVLEEGGIFVVGGHFGLIDGLNVQIDKNGNINKRLRSKRRWIQTLRKAGFTDIKVYRNNAYLWINDFLPENNVLVATK